MLHDSPGEPHSDVHARGTSHLDPIARGRPTCKRKDERHLEAVSKWSLGRGCKKPGERHPETFAFLGFTRHCGWTRDGRFIVKHKTQSKRLSHKLTALRQEGWRLMHTPLAEQHRWYSCVLRGHYGYFGMPHNWRSLNGFLREVRPIWFNCLRRRSQKNRHVGWDWFEALTARLPLPSPRIS
jgi:hypothetical protein